MCDAGWNEGQCWATMLNVGEAFSLRWAIHSWQLTIYGPHDIQCLAFTCGKHGHRLTIIDPNLFSRTIMLILRKGDHNWIYCHSKQIVAGIVILLDDKNKMIMRKQNIRTSTKCRNSSLYFISETTQYVKPRAHFIKTISSQLSVIYH